MGQEAREYARLTSGLHRDVPAITGSAAEKDRESKQGQPAGETQRASGYSNQ